MMGSRHRRKTQRSRLPALIALLALSTASLASVGAAGADVSTVSGGASGESVNVSLSGGTPTTSGPLPSVTLPSSGGRVSESAPPVAVSQEAPSAPFGGKLLQTGALAVTSKGTTRRAGTSSSSATVANVDALGGTLVTAEAGSRCASTKAGVTGSATLTGGMVRLSGVEPVALPPDPAPNTTFEGRDAGSGETFTVVVNRQEVGAGSITVTAVRIMLHGPSAVGDIVIAQSRCGGAGGATPSPAAPAAAGEAGPAPADPAAPTTVRAAGPTTAVPGVATQGAADPGVAAQGLAAQGLAAPGLTSAPLASQATSEAGGAYGYFVKIALFGGPAGTRGPEPSVDLPPTGDAPVSKSVPTGEARYAIALIFLSGPIDVTTQRKPDGSVTSSASITGRPASDEPPGPFLYGKVDSTCTSSGGNATASTTITGGVVETKYDATTQDPIQRTPAPVNPAPNTVIPGTLDHIGDTFRVVLNEQFKGANGGIVVNAVHLYMNGEAAAKGDLIIGQSRCGVSANASDPTGAGAGPGSSVAGASASRGGAGSSGSGSSGSAAGASKLASTGTNGAPLMLLAVALLAAGSALSKWARRRPVAGPEHRLSHEQP